MLARLHSELDLAILSIFGGSSALVIAAFAVYRLVSGSVVGAVVDAGISFGLFAIVIFAWRGNNVARAGAFFVGFAAIACVASSIVFGRTAAYWTFLVLSINFVVTSARAALIGSLVLIFAIAVQTPLFPNLPEHVIFVVTALLIMVYGWIFNTRFNSQRRQLEALAQEDPLTHAGNRRSMQHALVGAVSAGRDTGAPALLAVLDLDRFKFVNDSHGHEVGDKVLVHFAEIVRDRIRLDDGFFRHGGEEFVLLLPATNLQQGKVVLEDLRRLVEEGMQAISMDVTVSIGAATLQAEDDWSSWLRKADKAMYQAKDRGRNRVEFHAAAESDQQVIERRELS